MNDIFVTIFIGNTYFEQIHTLLLYERGLSVYLRVKMKVIVNYTSIVDQMEIYIQFMTLS